MTQPFTGFINRHAQCEPNSAHITLLVDAFYNKVRIDPLLAPVFAGRVNDWQAHHQKMSAFWRSVLLGTKEYKGHLMAVHANLRGLEAAHFSRWLDLFEQTMQETLPPGVVPYTRYIAQRFTRAMKLGLFTRAEQPREQAPALNPPTPCPYQESQGVAAC